MKFLKQNKYLFVVNFFILFFISNNCIAQKESITNKITGEKFTEPANIKPSVSKIEVQYIQKKELNLKNRYNLIDTNSFTRSRQNNISENTKPAISLISNESIEKNSSKMPVYEIFLIPKKYPSNVTPTVERVIKDKDNINKKRKRSRKRKK